MIINEKYSLHVNIMYNLQMLIWYKALGKSKHEILQK